MYSCKGSGIIETINSKERTFSGWLTVEIKDRQGDVLPISKIKELGILDIMVKRHAPITFGHADYPFAEFKSFEYDTREVNGEPVEGVRYDAKAHSDYDTDDLAWKSLQKWKDEGKEIHSSISWSKEGFNPVCDDKGECYKEWEKFGILSLAILDPSSPPANSEAPITAMASAKQEVIDGEHKHAGSPEDQEADGAHPHNDANPYGMHKHGQDGKSIDVKAYTSFKDICPAGKDGPCENCGLYDMTPKEFLTKTQGVKPAVEDVGAVCGDIWHNGSDEQRSSFTGGTQGRSRDEKPPDEWFQDCEDKVGNKESLCIFSKANLITASNGANQEKRGAKDMVKKDEGLKDGAKPKEDEGEGAPPNPIEELTAMVRELMDRIPPREASGVDDNPGDDQPPETEEEREARLRQEEDASKVQEPEEPDAETPPAGDTGDTSGNPEYKVTETELKALIKSGVEAQLKKMGVKTVSTPAQTTGAHGIKDHPAQGKTATSDIAGTVGAGKLSEVEIEAMAQAV